MRISLNPNKQIINWVVLHMLYYDEKRISNRNFRCLCYDKNSNKNLMCLNNELSWQKFHVLIISHNCFGIFADEALCVRVIYLCAFKWNLVKTFFMCCYAEIFIYPNIFEYIVIVSTLRVFLFKLFAISKLKFNLIAILKCT